MLNIFNFEKSMKFKWLKDIMFQTGHTWSHLLTSEIQKHSCIYVQWLFKTGTKPILECDI